MNLVSIYVWIYDNTVLHLFQHSGLARAKTHKPRLLSETLNTLIYHLPFLFQRKCKFSYSPSCCVWRLTWLVVRGCWHDCSPPSPPALHRPKQCLTCGGCALPTVLSPCRERVQAARTKDMCQCKCVHFKYVISPELKPAIISQIQPHFGARSCCDDE